MDEFLGGKIWSERSGKLVTVGVTDRAIEELGALDSVELPLEGESFDKGEVMLTLEGSSGSLEVIAPVAGVIHEINAVAQEQPEVITEDPLEEGWLVRLEAGGKSRNSGDADEEDEGEDESDDESEDEDEYSDHSEE